MPIVSQYNQGKRILYLTIIDKFNLSEFADALKEIIHSGDYPPDVRILLDLSSINVPTSDGIFDLDLINIRKIFLEMGKAKIAIITSDFTFGMGEKYEMLSDNMPQNIMIFDNFIEGEEWLIGIENE